MPLTGNNLGPEDDLAPAKGCIHGAVIVCAIWTAIVAVIWAVMR